MRLSLRIVSELEQLRTDLEVGFFGGAAIDVETHHPGFLFQLNHSARVFESVHVADGQHRSVLKPCENHPHPLALRSRNEKDMAAEQLGNIFTSFYFYWPPFHCFALDRIVEVLLQRVLADDTDHDDVV